MAESRQPVPVRFLVPEKADWLLPWDADDEKTWRQIPALLHPIVWPSDLPIPDGFLEIVPDG